MNRIAAISGVLGLAISASAQQLNEFEPNPVGADPVDSTIELKGAPGGEFAGWIITVESDDVATLGVVDRAAQVSGEFDGDGLLVVTVPDIENPSFNIFLTSDFTGEVGATDIDSDDDGIVDDASSFGTVHDAINVPDAVGDEAFDYASQLGGVGFAYIGDEPKLIFRDGATGELYAVDDDGAPDDVYDLAATLLDPTSFDRDPTVTTFGEANPTREAVPGCYADCDESGELDFFDFLCFQNEFAAGEAQADCDESGELDFFDFLCFQNEFAAGCP